MAFHEVKLEQLKMANVNLNKVFVYGTLKKHEPNHHWFSKDGGYSRFICKAETKEKYPLIIATKYNIPFLLYSPGHGNQVKGEVYEVDNMVLSNLDILEDHPNFYVREQHIVHNLDEAKTPIPVWIYFIKSFKPHLLKLPMFENYSNNDNHGLKYVAKYDRDPCYNYKLNI